jgi:hypothetical protein
MKKHEAVHVVGWIEITARNAPYADDTTARIHHNADHGSNGYRVTTTDGREWHDYDEFLREIGWHPEILTATTP